MIREIAETIVAFVAVALFSAAILGCAFVYIAVTNGIVR